MLSHYKKRIMDRKTFKNASTVLQQIEKLEKQIESCENALKTCNDPALVSHGIASDCLGHGRTFSQLSDDFKIKVFELIRHELIANLNSLTAKFKAL